VFLSDFVILGKIKPSQEIECHSEQSEESIEILRRFTPQNDSKAVNFCPDEVKILPTQANAGEK
jgi:hypothetical protein